MQLKLQQKNNKGIRSLFGMQCISNKKTRDKISGFFILTKIIEFEDRHKLSTFPSLKVKLEPMFLIVGLGNPGNKYVMTRHNIGFMACDYWLKSLGGADWRDEHKALTKKFKFEGHEVLLAKPQTFMNLSGESVIALMNFYKIDHSKLLVVHDEVDFPFGTIKMQFNRSPGGQNGVKNITQMIGSQEYARLRMGIGRPADPRFNIADYVLGNFSKEEQINLDKILETAADAIESFIIDGINKASTKYNGPVKLGG